ncbi:MAG: OFA family MFS transporter [Thermoguttaceae bacterium]|nr:OFA family MFS transporter [Thermoguttaceae bacterium]
MNQEVFSKSGLKNRGWIVAIAGLGINLALGVLYTWSVFSKAIPKEWGWSETDRSLPYAVAVLLFSLMMVPGGRLQDRLGPRVAATVGGLLVGLGFILASLTTLPLGWTIGFGVLVGSGIGFAYSAPIPAAVRWFPARQTGMISGIVVSGFGLAALYAAPLAQFCISQLGISSTVLLFGIAYLALIVVLAQLLILPPAEYVAALAAEKTTSASGLPSVAVDFSPGQVLRTPAFYMMWFMYACGAGAGLMIISKLATIGAKQAGIELGFLLVASLAIGNGIGRVVTGTISDFLGRRATLLGCFIFQAILILLLASVQQGSPLAHTAVLSVLSALIGANFGANLALFPAAAKDYFGMKHFGVNYGMLFTAYGAGGFLLSLAAGRVFDLYQSFAPAYFLTIALLVLGAVFTWLLPAPKREPVPA